MVISQMEMTGFPYCLPLRTNFALCYDSYNDDILIIIYDVYH